MEEDVPPLTYVTATPCEGAADFVHKYYRRRVRRSLIALVHSASHALGREYPRLVEVLDSLDVTNRFSPSLYAFNFLLQQAMNKNDAVEVASLLSVFAATRSLYAPDLQITNLFSSDWHKLIVRELIGMDLRDARGEVTVLKPVTSRQLRDATAEINEAKRIVSECHPIIGSEIQSLVSELTVFDGEVISGATDVRVFGNMFLRLRAAHQSATAYYCEHIVHEASHLYLDALLAHDCLVTNSDATGFSAPIRSDPRPLGGILHATFVISRMIQAFEAIAARYSGNPEYSKALELFRLQFAAGVKTLKRNGAFTKAGRHLLIQFEAQVDERYRSFFAA